MAYDSDEELMFDTGEENVEVSTDPAPAPNVSRVAAVAAGEPVPELEPAEDDLEAAELEQELALARQRRFDDMQLQYSTPALTPVEPTTIWQAAKSLDCPSYLLAELVEYETALATPTPQEVFDKLCWIADGVVVDSEHPYPPLLAQSLEVGELWFDWRRSALFRAFSPRYTSVVVLQITVPEASSIAVVFDPQSNCAPGQGRVQLFQDESLTVSLSEPFSPKSLDFQPPKHRRSQQRLHSNDQHFAPTSVPGTVAAVIGIVTSSILFLLPLFSLSLWVCVWWRVHTHTSWRII